MQSQSLDKQSRPATSATKDSSSGIAVQIRRLKMEENLLDNSIQKLSKEYPDYLNDKNDKNTFQTKEFITGLEASAKDISILFEDLKESTSENMDVDQVKKLVSELENKIQWYKNYKSQKLLSLQDEDKLLEKEIAEIPTEMDTFLKPLNSKIKSYNTVVPSPVKLLINSPLKCIEVQKFQAFMKNSKNDCAGWIPFNHNKFVQCWQKHFGDFAPQGCDSNANPQKLCIETHDSFSIFTHEIIQKIPGLTRQDMLTHCKWYSNYLHLKKRQQLALNKWKSHKNIIKGCCLNTKSSS